MSVQTLYTAATGMNAMETKLEVIANNLANVNTTGFKRGRANFEDLFYRHEALPGAKDSGSNPTATGTSIGLGTRVQSVQTDNEQGAILKTGNDFDVAIEGDGYLQVADPSGELLYTRAGNLSVNANGALVVASAGVGRIVQPPVTIPQEYTEVSITPEGAIMVRVPGQSTLTSAGQLTMHKFPNPEGLLKLGENMHAETEASGTPNSGNPGQTGLGRLRQGYLEGSNVEPVEELIDLITTQRSFELNSQCVQAGDQMLQLVANLRRF